MDIMAPPSIAAVLYTYSVLNHYTRYGDPVIRIAAGLLLRIQDHTR